MRALRVAGGLLVLVVGIVHLQQYADSIKDVPTIGVLFLLNAFGAGAIAVMLATRLRVLGALGGIALSAGALVSIAIAHYGTLFGYQEPDWRTAVVIGIVAEAGALLTLAGFLAGERRRARRPSPATAR